MEEDELVMIQYTGREDGEVFDTTREEVAEEEDLEREDANFEPVPVLIGREYVIEGLEDRLLDMEVGESAEVEVPPEKGYGERSAEDVQTYPEKEFKKQGVDVRPGEELMIGQRRGKVVSNSSGRVRIDFNHPLAGDKLSYELEVVERIEDDREIAEKIYGYRVGEGELEFDEGTVRVPSSHSHGDHEHELPEEAKDQIREEIEAATGLDVEF
ncbi:MAG: peptidylprolyl isomerase, partial [Candidatus Nanohaloarchaea archaeon]